MKKIIEIMRSNVGTAILFALAAVCLTMSTVGGARAALIYSQTYSSQVEMYDIGVVLMENGQNISWRDYDERKADGTWKQNTGALLEHMLDGKDGKQETLKLGYPYPEDLRVSNNGTINEYVRVSIYKYWMRQDPATGNWEKDADLSPSYINLHLVNKDVWQEDESARTDERTVLYYKNLLKAGKKSKPFADTISIRGDVANFAEVHTSQDGSSTVTTYDYDGMRFVLEARVDAVQEHNAEDAVWSTWGMRVNAGNSKMTLK